MLHKIALGIVLLAMLSFPSATSACSSCFGQSDAPMAQGLNMGILFLVGIVLSVLGGVVAFFVFLARRAAALNRAQAPAPAVDKGQEPEWSGANPPWYELTSPPPL